MNGQAMSVIETELRAMAEALRCGGDVAPGHRARLEGLMAFSISTGQVDGEHLCEMAKILLGDCGEVWIEGVPRLTLWQRRAPVSPTTTD